MIETCDRLHGGILGSAPDISNAEIHALASWLRERVRCWEKTNVLFDQAFMDYDHVVRQLAQATLAIYDRSLSLGFIDPPVGSDTGAV